MGEGGGKGRGGRWERGVGGGGSMVVTLTSRPVLYPLRDHHTGDQGLTKDIADGVNLVIICPRNKARRRVVLFLKQYSFNCDIFSSFIEM